MVEVIVTLRFEYIISVEKRLYHQLALYLGLLLLKFCKKLCTPHISLFTIYVSLVIVQLRNKANKCNIYLQNFNNSNSRYSANG